MRDVPTFQYRGDSGVLIAPGLILAHCRAANTATSALCHDAFRRTGDLRAVDPR